MRCSDFISSESVGAFIVPSKSKDLADAYLDSFNMVGMPYIFAIRSVLAEVKLLAESAEIESFMEKIALAYAKQNPHLQSQIESLKILAVGSIMLNMSHHLTPPDGRKKTNPMTLETFSAFFAAPMLTYAKQKAAAFYESITKSEIVMPSEQGLILGMTFDWFIGNQFSDRASIFG